MKRAQIKKIIKIINNNMEYCKITKKNMNDDLKQLGMDSITFIKIIVEIEEHFNIEIPDTKLIVIEMDTLSKILRVVGGQTN